MLMRKPSILLTPAASLCMLVAESADLSLDERQVRISQALVEQFGNDTDGCPRFYSYETFDDYVIARGPEAALYKIPYTIAGDKVTFGDATEVESAYVPVSESCSFVAESSTEDDDVYPIVILRAGWGTGAVGGASGVKHYYPDSFVQQVAEAAAQTVPFGRRHPDSKSPDPTGASDPQRVAGWIEGRGFKAGEALGAIRLNASESAMRADFAKARSSKVIDKLYATSMLAAINFKPGRIEGQDCLVAESLHKLYSVDLCQRAGAGGRFLAAASFAGNDIAAAQAAAVKPQATVIQPRLAAEAGTQPGHRPTGASMNKLQKLLLALRQKNANKAAEYGSRLLTATEAEREQIEGEIVTALSEGASTDTQPTTVSEAQTILDDAKRLNSKNRIAAKLLVSKLPKPALDMVNRNLERRLTAEADLPDAEIDAEITVVREAFAAAEPVGRRMPIVSVVLDTREKLALAMECALGVRDSMGKGVAAFRGLREAYVTITGDYELKALTNGGGFKGNLLASEAVATADFPNILLDAQHKLLLQEWNELALDGMQLLYTKSSVADYKLQNRVRDGYFPELSLVNENGIYTEITKPTDERIDYAVKKYGNLLTVSEETIRNDDLGAIARFPKKLARAGRWTLKNFITSFFINNPTYMADSLAWFHSSHANLGALAFGQDALIAAEIALMTQEEKDSNEPLGLSLDWVMVPPALAASARQLNQTNTAGANAFFQRFGVNNERIIVNEKLTDANDWYYGTNQSNAPFLEIGFLDGIDQPQILLANQPTVGTMFTNDQLQYKAKFVFGGQVMDFRGVGKNVVA